MVCAMRMRIQNLGLFVVYRLLVFRLTYRPIGLRLRYKNYASIYLVESNL